MISAAIVSVIAAIFAAWGFGRFNRNKGHQVKTLQDIRKVEKDAQKQTDESLIDRLTKRDD